MAYQRSSSSAKTDRAAIALDFISKNPGFSATFTGLLLAAIIGVFGPSQEIRSLSQRTGFLAGGAFIAYGAADRKLGALQAEVKRYASGAADVSAKASELEFKARQLAADEATMKERVETALKSASARELDRAKAASAREVQSAKADLNRERIALERKLSAADRNLETVKANLAKAALDLNDLKLAHSNQIAAINADAQQAQRAAVDAALLDKQVALDAALAEATAAAETATQARQALARANRELEAYKGQMGEVNERFNAHLQQTAAKVYESQAAVLDEAGAEARAAIERTALELQWEKQERIRVAAHNQLLQAPKLCTRYGPQGDMARKIQGAVHGLTIERTVDGQRVRENAGYTMHFHDVRESGQNDIFMFEPRTGTSEDFSRHKARIAEQSLRGAKLESIGFNSDTGCIEFTVTARKKAVVSGEDLSRLLKNSAYYLSRAKVWSRVGFYAPSETGKTSSAEILGYQWATEAGGDRYFHYPNKESVKNYVTARIASSGSDECAQAFANLVHLVDDIQAGRTKPLARKQHHVFDDSDTVISKSLDGLITREELLDFFTRASHCGIGFTLIGHSTSANRQGGMTHSDFNNLTRIYSGSDVMTALENTQVVSKGKAEALKIKYEKLRDLFEEKNEKLGLVTEGDSADPGAFRFALVIEANKAPYFCELPALDLLSAAAEGLPSITPQSPLNRPQHTPQQPSAEGTLRADAISHDTDTAGGVGVAEGLEGKTPSARKCRKCGGSLESQGIVKSGVNKGKRKFQCKSKKHTRAMGPKTTYFDD